MKQALPYREAQGRKVGTPGPLVPMSNHNHPNLCFAIELDAISLYLLNNPLFLFETLSLFSDLG